MTQNLLAQSMWLIYGVITILAAVNFRKAIGTPITVAMIIGAVIFLASSTYGLLTTYRLWGFGHNEESWVVDIHNMLAPWMLVISFFGSAILYISLFLVSRQVLRTITLKPELHQMGDK